MDAGTLASRPRYGAQPEPQNDPELAIGLTTAKERFATEEVRHTPETATALERLAYHIASLRKCLSELEQHLAPVSRVAVERAELLKQETMSPQTQVAAQIEESVKAIIRMDREVRDMISRLEI